MERLEVLLDNIDDELHLLKKEHFYFNVIAKQREIMYYQENCEKFFDLFYLSIFRSTLSSRYKNNLFDTAKKYLKNDIPTYIIEELGNCYLDYIDVLENTLIDEKISELYLQGLTEIKPKTRPKN